MFTRNNLELTFSEKKAFLFLFRHMPQRDLSAWCAMNPTGIIGSILFTNRTYMFFQKTLYQVTAQTTSSTILIYRYRNLILTAMHSTKMHGTPFMANWNIMNCCHGHHTNIRVPIDV